MNALLFGLLAAGGAALVVQNMVMTQISGRVSTVLIVLLLNSAVGLVLLSALLALRKGAGGFRELAAAFGPQALLPGILGSFFVFASLMGYQRAGAAVTISVLVASQLLFGLALDMARAPGGNWAGWLPSLIGAAMLVAGAFLVVSSRGP